jgi:manganese/iron transport system substrate-binding protein
VPFARKQSSIRELFRPLIRAVSRMVCGPGNLPAAVLAAALAAALAVAPAAAQPAPPKRVVTTFTILADMVQNVAGTAVIVDSLTAPGAEIHDYEPTPIDVVRAQAADMVMWNGLGLERWFERFFQRVQNVPQVVLTEGIVPIPVGDGPYRNQPNPHAWMSPSDALIYVENIRRGLARLDPANAATFAANAASYSAQLRAVGERARTRLATIPAERRWLVSCEGAFSYLTRDMAMREAYLWAMNSEDEGTPRQVRTLIDTVRRNRIPVVFCESTVSDRAIRQVAREAGARFGGGLYVDSLSAPDGPAPTFLRAMEYNAETILRGFGVASQAAR